jgi:hypothetical protein
MTSRTTLASCVASCALVVLPLAVPAATQDSDEWSERSRALADRLTGQLKLELQQALQAGGPVAAIDVCRTRAPAIAAQLSQESGAQVGRTALRVRNPANAPDELERKVLLQFKDELAAAKPPLPSPPEAVFELRTPQGVEHRYMRAIPLQPPCVLCHGKAIAPDVAAAIERHYPNDAATGFEPGELRGAVTVRWPAGQ